MGYSKTTGTNSPKSLRVNNRFISNAYEVNNFPFLTMDDSPGRKRTHFYTNSNPTTR